jgi:hypothetical protein
MNQQTPMQGFQGSVNSDRRASDSVAQWKDLMLVAPDPALAALRGFPSTKNPKPHPVAKERTTTE